MRVAFYTEADLVGGAERALGNVLAHLDASIEAAVVGTDPAVVEFLAERRPGSETAVLRRVRDKRDVHRFIVLTRAFRRLAPDVVHVNLTFPTSVKYALPAAMLARAPVVATEHLMAGIDNRWQLFLKRRAARRYAAHVTTGRASARRIERELGLREGSVRVIYNTVEDFEPKRDAASSQPVVGAVARYVDQKGLDVLIRAASELPDARFVLVGDGPERPELERLAAELGVSDRVELTGWSADTRRELSRFDVFALPSRYEGLPLALVDAMLCRLPIVATKVGDVSDAIDDHRHGLLVPPDDPPAFAAALRRLLTEPELGERLGEAAREKAARRFTAGSAAREYERLYEEVAGA